jgi:hypothetical protein
MKTIKKYHIDIIGNCSDKTNMYNWSEERLNNVIDTCWDKTISDLAKHILKSRKKQ